MIEKIKQENSKAIHYYSDLTDKPYDTYKEAKKAEKDYIKKHECSWCSKEAEYKILKGNHKGIKLCNDCFFDWSEETIENMYEMIDE